MTTALAIVLVGSAVVAAQAAEPTWLDRALANWNTPDGAMPPAPSNAEPIAEITRRCPLLSMKRNTQGERAVADAGWLPFHLFDRQIVDDDVEIVGGLAGVDAMCRPVGFNVFVFVGGRLAGTLSPGPMASHTDGSLAGGVRFADDTIAAEFARYAETYALCCPSGRVTVRYRIDRKRWPPVVVPVRLQPTRR